MYWIYLVLFILVVFTPEIVQKDIFFLREEQVESLMIFCFGMLGLLLYLGKESALLRAVRDKIFLQRETNKIRKDLSYSYSYIGEMNRRFDIVKNSLTALPISAPRAFSRQKKDLYQPIFEAVRLLTHSSRLRLLFVALADGTVVERHDVGKNIPEIFLDGSHLLATKKYSWEEAKYSVVRSPEDAFETAAFLIIEKTANYLEHKEVFQILVAEALFLYCIDRKKIGLNGSNAKEYADRH